MDDDDLRLDGNAAAGLLAELFRFEMTAHEGVCNHCGARSPLGALMVYGLGMGAVMRCPRCDQVVIRIGRSRDRYWIDLRGLSMVEIALPGG